jgi:ATP-binding cassette subfamily C protein
MRPLLRYAASGLRPRALVALLLWSIPETLPTAVFGVMVARALDDGFLAGRPWTGAAWLGGLMLAAALGAIGARGLYACLGATVEPFRDRLVRHVIRHALHTAVAGRPDSGAVSRLARQVEIARDAYAGVILAVRGCLVTAVGVTAGLLALDPLLALIIVPPFLLGLFTFIATLGFAAERHRRAAEADERLAARVGQVAAAVPDLAGCGGEEHGATLTAAPIARLAAAERALAGAAALRAVCFAIGGWLPLLAVLAAAPWLADRGLTAGALTGALLYVLTGIQPALTALVTGLGGSGLRLCVALSRILNDDAIRLREDDPEAPQEPVASQRAAGADRESSLSAEPLSSAHGRDASTPRQTAVSAASDGQRAPEAPAMPSADAALTARELTFAYGPHAAPAVVGLDLAVHHGDHLAIIGPSGIGKSTLAALLCGLLTPDSGTVTYGPDEPADALTTAELARRRVLIPQEAYVFTGTVRANLRYLHPGATDADLHASVSAVGAEPLVERLGGLDATVDPQRLSAGERQLLALVRAHCSPAPIAVLDEATCHLDPAAEARAEAAFAARGTLIVIAHRAASALRARRLLLLDGETVVAGDHEHLRAVSPLYRKLLAHWGPDHRAPVPAAQIQPAS